MSDSDDIEAIRALIHEYAFRIDAGDLDGVAALFEHAELGSSVRPERMKGTAEARRNYNGVIIYENGTPCTMHCLTNVTITIDGGNRTASARTLLHRDPVASRFPAAADHRRSVPRPVRAPCGRMVLRRAHHPPRPDR